jgi:hypothetical protein
MEVDCLDRRAEANDEQSLLELLKQREGADGAFSLSHDATGPWLSVHINGTLAFLYFAFDHSGRHPGFISTGSALDSSLTPPRFLIPHGTEGDAVFPPSERLVSVDQAYGAAVEFFRKPELPKSVEWFEL